MSQGDFNKFVKDLEHTDDILTHSHDLLCLWPFISMYVSMYVDADLDTNLI